MSVLLYAISKQLFGRKTSAMGVWAMGFLTITIIGASLILGKKLGTPFRV